MLEAILSLTILGVSLGTILGLAARYLKVEGNPLTDEIEEMLPGIQCAQCGYPGCRPYAEAIVGDDVVVTLCPPGGKAVAAALAEKMGVELDLAAMEVKQKAVAFVDESLCIGCTRCYQVCPTDSLLGAPQQLHTVIPDVCTSCEDCIEMCPTGALSMVGIEKTVQTWHWDKPDVPDLRLIS